MLRDRACRVLHLLEGVYGSPRPGVQHDPLNQLILTILSQNTSDRNSAEAYARLRARFPTWDAVLRAPDAKVAEAIRPGGLARIKAARIRCVLDRIQQQRGCLDLSFLREMPSPAVRAYLIDFPGVGEKTVACVLLFALGRPVLPVDTHVLRVSRRLGLVSPGTDAEHAHVELPRLLNPEQVYPFHMNLIAHGRRVCRARSPGCGHCVLRAECPTPRVRNEAATVG